MSNTPRPKKPRIVSIKVDPELDRELGEMAYKMNVTRSAVFREALREYAHGTRESALDLAGDVVGSLSGPGDLSTNKRRLKDFGK